MVPEGAGVVVVVEGAGVAGAGVAGAGVVVVLAAGGVELAGALPPQAAKVRARAKAAGTSKILDI